MTTHSSMSASGSGRWLSCPGSVALCAQMPPGATSKYAEEGTTAHDLAEAALSRGPGVLKISVEELVSMGIIKPERAHWVDQDMRENILIYYNAVMSFLEGVGKRLYIEQRVNLDTLFPGLFGTCDACVAEIFGTLDIVDLKYGKGKVVDVEDNPQLMYYALGALLALDEEFKNVRITVVQPRGRAADTPVRSWMISVKDLLEWGENVLKPGAIAASEPEAPLIPGPWCSNYFCDAQGQCPAKLSQVVEVAQMEFQKLTPQDKPAFMEPQLLTPNDISKVLSVEKGLTAWFTSVKAIAYDMVNAGLHVPGFKLVEKRRTRQWKNPEKVGAILGVTFENEIELVYEPKKLKSVAQMEKSIGKKAILADWVEKPDKGTALAPVSDRRAEIFSGAEVEFTKIEM